MGYFDTITTGGMSQTGDNSDESVRKRAARKRSERMRSGDYDKKRSGSGFLGMGAARRAARKLKAREHDVKEYLDNQ